MDFLVVPLLGASRRPLPGQAELMEQSADMIRVVAGAEAPEDHFGHARGRPEVVGEAVGLVTCSPDLARTL
jgi:hypothetical protein